MLIRLGAAITVMVQLRGKVYQFYLRIPQHLVSHYDKEFIRKSIHTSDLKVATRKADEEAKKYEAEFKALTDGYKLTPKKSRRQLVP